MKYLKNYQDYSDRYDKYTIEMCRDVEKFFENYESDHLNETLLKEKHRDANNWMRGFKLHFLTGERYINKSSTIRKWMERDEQKDLLMENAQPPADIRCFTCRNRLRVLNKVLDWSNDEKKKDRVLFTFECPNLCMPKRAFYNDGEEYRYKRNACPKCDYTLTSETVEATKEFVITKNICKKCEYSAEERYDFSKLEEDPIDIDFATDRDRFCLSEKEGQEYESEKRNLAGLENLMKEIKEREDELKEKLKENPNGFILNESRLCTICQRSSQEGLWYDSFGIKCLICQKAVDENEIPPTTSSDKESWYTKYDMQSRFNLKSQDLKKWINKGIIKIRNISHYGKGSWYEIFLIEDNKDFLPPKKLTEPKGVNTTKDGKSWFHTEPWYKFVDPKEHLKDYKIINYLTVIETNLEKDI